MLADRPDLHACATGPRALRNHPAVDFAEAKLLDGLEGEDRAARERLLHRLVEEGYSLQDLQRAVREERLALLLVDRMLGGRYTARELEKRTGQQRR